jgi:hypothetical protein
VGQVIRLTVPSDAYPATTDALDTAETVFLLAVRWWVEDYRRGEDPIPRQGETMRIAGAHDTAFSVDQLMAVVARTVRQPISIHCPRCPHVSRDETHLLHAASLVQAGESRMAERALRTALLSASGAAFALGLLKGLGELFTEARLFFRKRQVTEELRSQNDAAWLPSAADRSLH